MINEIVACKEPNVSIVPSPNHVVLDNDNHMSVLFTGTYTQCLVYVGGIMLHKSHEDATNIANEVSIDTFAKREREY